MKQLIIVCLSLFIGYQTSHAQFTNYTISPAVYTAEDEVTITIDVTGTPLEGVAQPYIWTWANEVNGSGAIDAIVNTAWTNSPDAAKFTAVAGQPNKFTFKMIGTALYNRSPGELKHFQFLVKAKDGSKQTANTGINKFDPLVFIPSMLRIFPARVGQNDVISIYFHQDLATSINEQRMEPTTVTVEVFDNTGASAGQPVTLPVKSAGTKLWKAYFVPTRSYTPGAGKKFVRFTYKFNGTIRDENNAAVTVSTASTEITLADMK
jgi:hypothetical protein